MDMKNILFLFILITLLLISGCTGEIKSIEKEEEIGEIEQGVLVSEKIIVEEENKITECDSWDFYRGECGQELSYCKIHGYELKNLTQYQGWIKGGICIDENGTEVGSIGDLMNLSRYGSVDLSGVYCMELGYKMETRENEKGQYGVCIFSEQH